MTEDSLRGPSGEYIKDLTGRIEEQADNIRRLKYQRSILSWLLVLIAGLFVIFTVRSACAHDHERPDLDKWFESLHAFGALCCNGKDQRPVEATWDMDAGRYRVRLLDDHTGKYDWYDVPEMAIVHGPNLAGYAMVWWSPVRSVEGKMVPQIRCFMPGSGA